MGFSAKSFAQNLRETRLQRGLTQRELGERLGFSEKTVSKWENGASIPDIEALFSICEVLQTKIETLFSEGEHYYLGIDGGGTKTALMLVDERGDVVRTLRADACNPVDIGMESAQRILKDAIFEICRGIAFSDVTLFAGISGGASGNTKEQLNVFFESFGFFATRSDSDNVNIIAAGLGERDGITVILGTGFCVYTQRSLMHHRISGWGYLLDDGGSGYNLGRDALHAYFSAYDGSGEKTALTDEIDKAYAGGAHALISYVYGKGKKAFASFAPTVFAACRRGDRIACEILERNMREVARMIEVAMREFDGRSVPIVFAGGLTHEECVVSWLERELKEKKGYSISILNEEPVTGAVILARKLGGKRK